MTASPLFTWSADYSIGIQAIDEQHQVLIELINQLHRAIVEHHGKATACDVLDRVAEYTRSHFQLEERLMQLSRYPDFETHRRQHLAMIEQIQLLRHRFYDENKPIAFELLYTLKQWLIQHINESDKRFGVHFAESRAAAAEPPAPAAPAPGGRPGKWWSR